MIPKKCKLCKYWGGSFGDYHNETQKICDREGNIQIENNPESSFRVEARATDDSGLEAYLVTGPEYGCIHFTIRECIPVDIER